MKIELSEKEIKSITESLENSARIFGQLRIDAIKCGNIKAYNEFRENKTDALLAHRMIQSAYDKEVNANV